MTSKESKHCLKLLERYQYCDQRATYADNRSRRHPGTNTMHKELDLVYRWETKASKAWDELVDILQSYAGASK